MRRLHTAVGAGVLLLAMTACAEKQPEVGFGGQPPAPPPAGEKPTKPVEPKPVEQRKPVPKQSVNASRLPEGYPTEVWTQNDGKVVVVIGQEGGCSQVHAEVARENGKKVKIVLVEETPKPSGVCTMDLRYPPVTARLDAPLGDRTVVLTERNVTVPAG